MMTRRVALLSLRARFMLIVIVGAIIPFGLIGAWLTASSARSGRELLQSDLDSSLAPIARRMRERWQLRAGDLALLAGNDQARRLLSGVPLDSETTRYFDELTRATRLSIDAFTYKDTSGRTRWSSQPPPAVPQGGALSVGRAMGLNENDAVIVRRTVWTPDGRRGGTVEARVLLSSMLPTDSLRLIVAGAALRIRNRETGDMIDGGLRDARGPLVFARTSFDDPPLDLELAASDARYVEPFARAGRLGLASLFVVAALVIALTGFLSRRLTASVEQLVEATSAVASGDLDRTVSAGGSAELSRLAATFNAMTDSLRRTLQALGRREALAAVGQFAASISHEVRNALTSVRLDLQRLHEHTATTSPDRELIARAIRNVNRLDSIVTGSLRIARTSPESMRPVALEGVLHGALGAAEPTLLETGTRVELLVAGSKHVRVRGDAAALEQMFLNLLINSAQAMDHGGTATISVEPRDNQITVLIADNGHGISTDDLAKLGQPFFSSKPTGTGLGFPIARQIATAHGGDVAVRSTSAAGTIVAVTLPSERAATGAKEVVGVGG